MPNTATAMAGTERKIDRLLAHYEESHRHPLNEAIHLIAVPAIFLSIVGLLYAVHPWAAWAAVAASLAYYALLKSPMMFVGMLILAGASLAAVHAMGDLVLPACVLIFVVAWIFQFIGHKIEGKKPSFFEDIQYLLVGPLFVLSRLSLRFGVSW